MPTETTPPGKHKFIIQMSGAPGSGKSTLAKMLGESIDRAVIIDHDVLKSALLNSGIAFEEAAKQAYEQQWESANNIVEKQGRSVIIDSTCNFQEVLNQGLDLARRTGYSFWYVECQVQDINLLDERLRARSSMMSQRTGVDCPPAAASAHGAHSAEHNRTLFKKWIEHPQRPTENMVIVDSTIDSEELRDQVLKQIFGQPGEFEL
jgi:predicted kinase